MGPDNEPELPDPGGSSSVDNRSESNMAAGTNTGETDESTGSIHNDESDIPEGLEGFVATEDIDDHFNGAQDDGSEAADGPNVVVNDGIDEIMDDNGGSDVAGMMNNGEASAVATVPDGHETELAVYENEVTVNNQKIQESRKKREEALEAIKRYIQGCNEDIERSTITRDQAQQKVNELKAKEKASETTATSGDDIQEGPEEETMAVSEHEARIGNILDNVANLFDDITYEPGDTLGEDGWREMWTALGLTSIAATGRDNRAQEEATTTTRSTRSKKARADKRPKGWSGLYLEVRETWDKNKALWCTEPEKRPPGINVWVLCLCMYKEFIHAKNNKADGVANSTIIQSSQLFRLVNEFLKDPEGDARELPLDAIGLVIQKAYDYFEEASGEKGDSLIVLSIWQLCKLLRPQNESFQRLYNDLCAKINENFPFNRKLIYKVLTADDDFLAAPNAQSQTNVVEGITVPNTDEVLVGRKFAHREDRSKHDFDFPVTVVKGPDRYHLTVIDERSKNKPEPKPDKEHDRAYPYIFAVNRNCVHHRTNPAVQMDKNSNPDAGRLVLKAPGRDGADPTRYYEFEVDDYRWWKNP